MSADWRLLFEVLAIVTMTVGNIAALTQSEPQAHARVLVDRARRLPADRRRRRHAARRRRRCSIYLFDLRVHAARRLRRRRPAAPRRTSIGDELKDLSGLYFRQPVRRVRDAAVHAVARRHPADRRLHGQVLAVRRRDRAGYVWLAVIGVLNSAVSLYYYIRIVVFMYLKKETTGSEPRAEPGAGVRARRRRGRRRSCSASTRGCCSSWPRRRRARSGAGGHGGALIR